MICMSTVFFFFSSRRRHTRCGRDWSSDVCSSDLALGGADLILLVGTKLDFRLNYGEPPLIPREAKIVWLDTLQTDIGVNRGADVGVAGDVAGSLRALAAGLGKGRQHD